MNKARENNKYNTGRVEENPEDVEYRGGNEYREKEVIRDDYSEHRSVRGDRELERSHISPGNSGYYGSNPYGMDDRNLNDENYYSSNPVYGFDDGPYDQDNLYDDAPIELAENRSPGRKSRGSRTPRSNY